MKKLAVFFAIVLFVMSGCNKKQEMKNDRLLFGIQYTEPNSDEPLNGEKTFYYNTGEVRTKAIFASGYPEQVTHFYRNGLKRSKVTYENRGIETIVTWFKNGQKRHESISNLTRQWYKSGQRKLEAANGIVQTWYENGQLKARAYYEDDGKTLHGITKAWYKDGTLKGRENYSHGKLDGKRVKWDANGSKILVEIYDQGKLVESYES